MAGHSLHTELGKTTKWCSRLAQVIIVLPSVGDIHCDFLHPGVPCVSHSPWVSSPQSLLYEYYALTPRRVVGAYVFCLVVIFFNDLKVDSTSRNLLNV